MRIHAAIASALLGLMMLMPPIVASQDAPAARAVTPPPADFGFADLMNLLVQPRHIKLNQAAAHRNWELAAAESRNLRASFVRISQHVPKYLGNDVAEVARQMLDPPLQAVDKAIAAADSKRFGKAFADLTAACNACHLYMEHPYIVIKVPEALTADAYPDQDFRPNP